jgi:hypothetical protein
LYNDRAKQVQYFDNKKSKMAAIFKLAAAVLKIVILVQYQWIFIFICRSMHWWQFGSF